VTLVWGIIALMSGQFLKVISCQRWSTTTSGLLLGEFPDFEGHYQVCKDQHKILFKKK
jgi:hypothetical protein